MRYGLLIALWVGAGWGGHCSLWAHSYDKSLDQFVMQAWNTAQGLPQNSITKMIQSEQGFIWFGTHEGLVRFDGVEFRVFNHKNIPFLESNMISALAEDRNHRLWFADERGKLYYLDEQLNCRQGPSLEMEDDWVSTMVSTRHGALWMGTYENGIFVYENNVLRQITLEKGDNHPIWDFLEDDFGRMWVATQRGLYRLEGDRVTRFGKEQGLNSDRTYCLEQDIQGRIWVGGSEGVNVIDGETIHKADTAGNLPEHGILDIEEDQQGEMWLATAYGGIARMTPNLIVHQTFTQDDGLPNNNTATLLPDHDGNVWVGIESGGLVCFRNGPAITWTKKHGLPDDMVRTVLQSSDQQIWVGTDSGLSRFNGKRFSTVDLGINGSVTALYDDGKGGLWVGIWDRALIHYQPETDAKTIYEPKSGLPATAISAISADLEGNIWIASRKGLIRMRDGFFESFTVHNGLPTNLVTSLLIDRDGILWAGTRGGGLCRFENGNFTIYTRRDGLSSNQILALFQDETGTLWIGTSDNGLNRKTATGFEAVNVSDGLFDDKILALQEDENKRFWMTSNRGIFSIPREDITRYLDIGREGRLKGRVFGMEDGMKSNECNGGTFPAAAMDHFGNLWVPTIEGVVSLDSEHEIQQGEAPPVFISRVKLNGKHQNNLSTVTIAPGPHKMEIHFSGVNLTLSKRLRFRYQMVGLEETMQLVTHERIAHYSNLPPGTYSFRVWAGNEPDYWGDDYAEITVIKRAAWWQRTSTRIAVVCLLLAGIFSLDRHRLRRNQERHALLEQMVQERSSVLQGTHQRLITAQEQVIEAAHRAGMAEIACNVLHQVDDVVRRVEQESQTAKTLFEAYQAPQTMMRWALALTDPEKARDPANNQAGHKILQQLKAIAPQKEDLAEQLSRINNQVFQLTQIVSAQQKYAKQDNVAHSVDINALIADAVKIKNKDLRRTQAEVIQDLNPVPTFYLQRAKILRVLLGLLQHSCESMNANGPERPRKILITSSIAENSIKITIQDTGPCVPENELVSVFAQNASPRATTNRFILHACANAVTEMDGEIQAACAADGGGMLFVLQLPVQPHEDEDYINEIGDDGSHGES
ncbi:two-component regulator propeller domain-containing protein [Acanthopleuribacter pedis]|uniref:Histidine kinase domain-containing protein n=1 Tax=Acanthopleuribacter pedis TaxID=442870 RepID=A0A8J7Q9M7_9BACT|nr:two-component regulator propeller domain-containing protein [Acanthopleuribacter pedis]MBO1316946.1 hypothetical protein [Acanthopleuribacter pedis]